MDVDQQMTCGITPLMLASNSGHFDVCEFLLQNHADINLRSKPGNNALYFAVSQEQNSIYSLLLIHGANIDNINNKGKTILDTANATKNQVIISLIKQHKNIENEDRILKMKIKK